MRVATTPAEMAALADAARRDGKRIALVPTMGALHAGHSSLLHAAQARADVVVLSIFVNPLQFGPKEDLSRYPRTPDADAAIAQRAGADLLYAPMAEDMYPPGFQTTVTVADLEQGMDGASRPGHFRGVATVVLKLFSAIKPHVAFFGQKDYQQLQVIRRMVRDLDLGIDIVGMPIVREQDGLAMSSRNTYLSSSERVRASDLSRALRTAEQAFASGERDADALLARAQNELQGGIAADELQLEYLDLRDATTLAKVRRVDHPAVLAIAARVGTTRLIDNIVLG